MRVDNCYGIAFSKVMRATYGVCTVLYIEYRTSKFVIRYSAVHAEIPIAHGDSFILKRVKAGPFDRYVAVE